MSGPVAIALFVVGVVVSIMVHEWGHFATARAFGMRVDRFFLGFGPTLWSTQRGETEYGVKALPLGGFVRIKGMSPTDERLRPVPDVVFDPDQLAEDRRSAAAATGGELTAQPALTDAAFDRLDRSLRERGAPRDVRERMVARLRSNVRPDATPAEARRQLVEIIASEVRDTGRVGDLHHRLVQGDEGRFFPDRPAWQRAIVLASGSGLHFVQAIVLLFVGFLLFGQSVVVPAIDGFTEDGVSVAEEAGLEVGDRFVSIAGVRTEDFLEVREIIRARPGEPTEVIVDRDGDEQTFIVTPQPVEDPETGETIGVLGFYPAGENRPLPADEALYETFIGPGSFPALVAGTFQAFGHVFGPEGLGLLVSQIGGDEQRSPEGGISLVGAANIAGQGTTQFGPLLLFALLASVNVFVGIFNILPLPPLDGGHLAVLGVEQGVNRLRRLRGLPTDFSIDERTVAAIAVPVIVFVATISVAFLWLDITNPIQLGP